MFSGRRHSSAPQSSTGGDSRMPEGHGKERCGCSPRIREQLIRRSKIPEGLVLWGSTRLNGVCAGLAAAEHADLRRLVNASAEATVQGQPPLRPDGNRRLVTAPRLWTRIPPLARAPARPLHLPPASRACARRGVLRLHTLACTRPSRSTRAVACPFPSLMQASRFFFE